MLGPCGSLECLIFRKSLRLVLNEQRRTHTEVGYKNRWLLSRLYRLDNYAQRRLRNLSFPANSQKFRGGVQNPNAPRMDGQE